METILSTESVSVRVMVSNVTFNNISGISWQSVLLEKKREYTGKTIDLSQVTDKLYHIMSTTIKFHEVWRKTRCSSDPVLLT